MKNNGIDLQILAPEMTLAVGLPADEEARWAALVNDSVAEDIAGRPEFVALALLPMSDGAEAAAELGRRMDGSGFCGGMIHTRPLGGLDSSHLDALWEAASRLDAPLVLHSVSTTEDESALKYQLDLRVGRPHDVTIGALKLVFGGILDRFSDLKIILTVGGGSIALLSARLDADYGLRPEARSTTFPPSTYIRRFYFDTLVFGEDELRFLVECVGAHRMMFGTDYPLPVFQEDPEGFLDGGRERGLTDAEFGAIARENANEIFVRRNVARASMEDLT